MDALETRLRLRKHTLYCKITACIALLHCAYTPRCSRADIPSAQAALPPAQRQDANAPSALPLFAAVLPHAPAKSSALPGEAAGKEIRSKAGAGEQQSNPGEQKPPAAPFPAGVTVGGELFFGIANITGARAGTSDGVWAGSGEAYPSSLSLNWKGGEARALRVSIGVGDMYTGRGASLRQPVEAFYQGPVKGGSSFTLGKFYVPFALQEWEYESKWGGMVQGVSGRMGYAASVNYNTLRGNPNVYLRAGRQWQTGTALGVSVAAGRGIFSDTSHAAACGVDLTQELKGVRLNAEYNAAYGSHGMFQFAFGKLTFTGMTRLEPYLAVYYTGDQAQELSRFRSALAGVNYHLTRSMALEGGGALVSGRKVFWLQSHVTF